MTRIIQCTAFPRVGFTQVLKDPNDGVAPPDPGDFLKAQEVRGCEQLYQDCPFIVHCC